MKLLRLLLVMSYVTVKFRTNKYSSILVVSIKLMHALYYKQEEWPILSSDVDFLLLGNLI